LLAPLKLLGFAMRSMLPAARAILAQFHAARIITAIFLGSIVSLFAITTLHGDNWANIFLFRSHFLTLLSYFKERIY
jgi:hypothetical protein